MPQCGHGLSALGYAYLVAARIDEALVALQKAYVSMLEAAGIPAWLARTRSWGSMRQRRRFGVGLERHDRMHPLASFSVGHADHRSGDHDAGLEQVARQCL